MAIVVVARGFHAAVSRQSPLTRADVTETVGRLLAGAAPEDSSAVRPDSAVDGRLRVLPVVDGLHAVLAEFAATDAATTDAAATDTVLVFFALEEPAAAKKRLRRLRTELDPTTGTPTFQERPPAAPVAQLTAAEVLASLETPAGRAEFLVVAGPNTEPRLENLFTGRDDGWRFFLDPAQQTAAEPGPPGISTVTGGPGTGKTTVALHRIHRLWRRETSGRLLLTTLDQAGAHRLSESLVCLAGKEILERVDVLDIDTVVRQTRILDVGQAVRIDRDEPARWARALQQAAELGDADRRRYTPQFLAAEYRRVIVGGGLRRLDDYLAASRADRGVVLDGPDRVQVWRLVEAFESILDERGVDSRERAASRAADFAQRARQPGAPRVGGYRHIVVDEAPEISPTQLRLLKALLDPARGTLLLCGNGDQRIHADHDATAHLAIDGPRHRLDLDHRSTEQISEFAAALLAGPMTKHPRDSEAHAAKGDGPPPLLRSFDSATQERDAVIGALRRWRTEFTPEDPPLAVLTPTTRAVGQWDRRLRAAGIATVELGTDQDIAANPAVRVGAFDQVMGREFSGVAVSGVGIADVPPEADVDRIDPGDRPELLRRWRALLALACSRARERLLVTWTGAPSVLLSNGEVEES
ncbi:AAA family ATPase [Actinoalloteichus hymeniacidonis]|uniref:AAA domain protein n=1 Tax=Actinoalloteichus hymeniacidonis TaxID=340345 RepID=A0AAC9MW68_9PSEU|nr:AAA family ATPase [Actinoalloteichus hymeniacidonis]AOS60945.1 AAA domain protein [Actinoalloteichus hymeniacidonis]MBB5911054.1 hypothetical protein [Actinoalloteichus hymeniacidonis]